MVLTLPPPPVPSTSRTIGMRKPRASFRVPHFVADSRVRGAAAYGESSPPTTTLRDRSARNQPDKIGGGKGREAAPFVIGGAPGQRPEFVKRAVSSSRFDSFANRQATRRVLPLDIRSAAHLAGHRLTAANLIDSGFPTHSGYCTQAASVSLD